MSITYISIADNLCNSSVSYNCSGDINIFPLCFVYLFFFEDFFKFTIHWVTINEVVLQKFLFFCASTIFFCETLMYVLKAFFIVMVQNCFYSWILNLVHINDIQIEMQFSCFIPHDI